MGDSQQDDLVNHLLNNLKVPLENAPNMQNANLHPSMAHGMGLQGMMNPMGMNQGMGLAPTMAGNGSNMGLAAQSQWEEYLGKYGASEADFVQNFAVLPSPFLYPSAVQQPYAQYYYGGGLYQPMIDPTTLGLYYQQQLQNTSYFGAPTANPEMVMPEELPQDMVQNVGVAVPTMQPEPQQVPGVAPVAAVPPTEEAQKGKPEGRRTWADVMKAPAKPQPPPQPAQPKGASITVTTSTTTAASSAPITVTAPAPKAKPEQLRTVPITTKPTQTVDTRKREGKAIVQDRVPYTGEPINPRDFDVNPRHARFFVIKSYSEDDVHKSIKYAIWASTDSGNRRLDQAYKESGSTGPIYLFFSVNASGQFCGMAQMLSPLDFSKKSDLWAQDKWNGQFLVKWIFIKDIPNSVLRHIRLENNDGKPVTNSRDTQEILLEPGREMLKIFRDYQSKTSILDDLSFYDKRQEMMKDKKEGEKSEKSDGSTTPVSGPSSATTSPSLPSSTPASAPPTMAGQTNSAATGKTTKPATNAPAGKAASNAKPKK